MFLSPQQIFAIIIIIFIFTMWILISTSNKSEAFVGCALTNCPQGIQDWYYKNGGVPYYSTFPQGSKEYWHSYCTLLPNKCG